MKVSVITAVFNRVASISCAIDSVKNQDYPLVEHVIVDGGSTDGTLDVIKQYSSLNIRVISEPDNGIYDALNKGFYLSSGEIIAIVHSDDYLVSPSVLSTVASAFEDISVDGVYGDLEYVSNDDSCRIVRYWRAGEYHPELLRYGWMPPHPTLFLRRKVIEKFGGYNTDFRISADYDAMLRYLRIGKIKLVYIPQVLVRMRVGGASNRSLASIYRKSVEDYRVIRGHKLGGVIVLFLKNATKVVQFFVRARS